MHPRPRVRPSWFPLLVIAAMSVGAAACTRDAVPTPPEPKRAEPARGRHASTPKLPTAVKQHSVEGISEYTLPNGLRVLLFPDPSRARVTVNVTYLVGSRHEGYGETGMAHLLEHMLFKGTKAFPKPWGDLQDHGAFFNGTTWLDRTNYYETMPASEENLAWALRFEADRMVNNPIDAAELAKEFSVVRNEFEMDENDPGTVLNERILSSAYLWHNYGKSTIGSRSDIEHVPAARLRSFYKRYYRPDNAVLVVAGDFEEARALQLVREHFGALPKPPEPLPATYTVEPIQDGAREVILRRSGDIGLVGLVYHSVAGADPDYAASEALLHLLIDEPSGRLYKQLVETGEVAGVDGFTTPLHDPGWIELDAEVPVPDDSSAAKAADRQRRAVETIRDRMIAIIEDVARAGVTAAEVDRYRNSALKRFDLAMANTTEIAIELSEWAALGDWRMMFLHRDRVEALTAADVERFARAYLRADNRTAGLFLPTDAPARAPQPPQPDLAAMLQGYTGRGALAAGEAFAATLPNIESRTARARLEPGVALALLPKRTRGRTVTLRLRLRYGDERTLAGKQLASTMLPYLLLRGTEKHDYQQLRDAFDRLRASVWFEGDPGVATVTVTTIRASVPEVLALVAEALRAPAFPKREFEILRKEWKSSLLEDRGDPSAQASLRFERALSPYSKGHVRYTPSTDEALAELHTVKLRDLKDIHKRLWGASAAELSVVGDFDPDELKAALTREFGDWRSPQPYARAPEGVRIAGAASVETINTPDKEMAMVVVGHGLELRDDAPDYPALLLTNYILGGSSDSRLNDRLREREGWSYGAYSGVYASAHQRVGEFVASAICAPQNAHSALAAVVEEIERLRDGGVTKAELETAKTGYLAEFKTRLTNDGAVADDLIDELYLGRTTEFTAKQNAAIAALTPADIQRVAKTYLRPERLIQILAGDLKKSRPVAATSAEPADSPRPD